MAKSTGQKPTSRKPATSGHYAKRSSRTGQFVTVGFASKGMALPAGALGKTILKRTGGSLTATVPAAARHALHLEEGQEMTVKVEGSRVVLEPVPTTAPKVARAPKYTLDELLAGSGEGPMTDDERAWHDEPAVGREIW